MYSFCSVLNSSLRALNFYVLALVGFLLLHNDAFFTLSHFFLTASVSFGTQHLALDLVGMHFAAASMWALMKFSYSSFGVCVSDTS